MPPIAADMIEVQPLTAFLVAEAMIVLALALVFVLFGAFKKRRGERKQADDLVERLNVTEESHLANLAQELSAVSGFLDEPSRRQTIQALYQREKALYREVIQNFLTRDAARLDELDRHVRDISEPYRRLLQEISQRCGGEDPAKLRAHILSLEEQARQARQEIAHLRVEVGQTLATLDEISKEYAKMFGEEHTAADLHASRLRMLNRFRQAAGLFPDEGGEIDPAPEEPRFP